jgi:ABC-type transport system involved in multi-copper enzyme maturation permease subunit
MKKALAIAQKDIERLLKSVRFFFSMILASLVALGLLLLPHFITTSQPVPSGAGTFLSSNLNLTLLFVFTLVLPGLILAFFISHSDILSRERSEGTISILFSQPVSNMSIVLGKFLTIVFTSLVFSLLNVLLLGAALSSLGVTPFMFVPFFFAILLFQLSIGGLTLLFSSLFKRSFMVLVMVVFFYVILVILYSSQLTLSLDLSGLSGSLPPGVVQQMERSLRDSESEVRLIIMFTGILFGYATVPLVNTVLSGLLSGLTGSLATLVPSGMSGSVLVKIMEPPILRFIPINVNAQRLLYLLTSPNPAIETLEIVASVFGLIGITALSLFLSLLVIRKARAEYTE